MKKLSKKIGACACALVVGLSLGHARPALATTYTLTDEAATFKVDPDTGSSAGVNFWAPGAQNQLTRQWFWYKTPSMSTALPINQEDIGAGPVSIAPAVTLTDSPFSTTGDDVINLKYTYTSGLSINVKYALIGATDGLTSTVNEDIDVTYPTPTKALKIFQYNNFDLGGTAAGDSVTIGTLDNSPPPPYNTAHQSDGPVLLHETSVTPDPDQYRADDALALLGLVNSGADLVNQVSYSGSDAAWAFQWNNPDQISKVRTIAVPEPATLAGMGVGGLMLMLRPGRKRKAITESLASETDAPDAAPQAKLWKFNPFFGD